MKSNPNGRNLYNGGKQNPARHRGSPKIYIIFRLIFSSGFRWWNRDHSGWKSVIEKINFLQMEVEVMASCSGQEPERIGAAGAEKELHFWAMVI